MRLISLLSLFLIYSCFDDNLSPEAALKNFTEARIGNVVTRQFIVERVTGKMKVSFETMDEETFKKFADLRHVKKGSFKIVSKSCQDKKCFLTYQIAYNSTNETGKYESEVKKIAELNLVEGRWLIADVSNIKTYIEAQDPINPLE
jgi:hypothetical protein